MRLISFSFLFLSFLLNGQDIDHVRKLYLDAGDDRNKTIEFRNFFDQSYPEDKAIFIAYHGTALTMMADLVKGNMNKYKVFVEGRDLLEKAILKNPESIEIRYLRFAIQTNIPRILGYNNIKEDTNYLVENINNLSTINNKELHDVIVSTLLNNKKLSESEKLRVNQYKSALN